MGREDAKRQMAGMFSDGKGMLADKSLHKPQNPGRTLPLLTYFCRYGSVVGAARPEARIGLFYGSSLPVSAKKIRPPFNAVGVDANFEAEAYGYCPLIGDKPTALVFDAPGLRATDPNVSARPRRGFPDQVPWALPELGPGCAGL